MLKKWSQRFWISLKLGIRVSWEKCRLREAEAVWEQRAGEGAAELGSEICGRPEEAEAGGGLEDPQTLVSRGS